MSTTRVCVSLAGTMAEVMAGMERAAVLGADLVELRLDLMPSFDLEALLARCPLPAVVTYRPKRAGGEYRGPEEERLAVLRRAIDLGAAYLDVEPDCVHLLERRGGTRLIVSHHNFEGVPRPLAAVHERLGHLGADIVKVAVTAADIQDNLEVFDLLRRSRMPTIALAMGEPGAISRILAGRFGAYLTFASLDAGHEVAPGQLALADLLGMYRARHIGPRTRLYGVMANPVGHSMSPAVHNAAFAELGLDAVYLPLLVREPRRFLETFTPLGFGGYSVTIPHKQAVMPSLDGIEPLAARIGAVNTIVVREGRLHGYNTDVDGALDSIAEAVPGISFAGTAALLVGAGGLGRALAHGLADRGARLTIVNRGYERAQALAAEVGATARPIEDMAEVEAELLLQTTSVGMHPKVQESIVPRVMLRPGLIVYDAVYNPLETRLLREAKEAGCITVSGLGHFINQAARQFELWTGREAPRQVMRRAMLERLGH